MGVRVNSVFCGRRAVALLLPIAMVIAAGCGKPKELPAGEGEIRKITVLCGIFTSQNKGKPPKTVDQLKEFLKKSPKSLLDSNGINLDNLEATFTSPRDKQPYVIRFSALAGSGGVPGGPPTGPPGKSTGGESNVLVYEQTGVGGKRMIAFSHGEVKEVEEATLKSLVPDLK